MRKSNKNRTRVEGYLYECKLEKKVSGPTSKNPGTEFIRGSLDIAIDDEGMNVISTYFTYVAPKYSSGSENRNFAILEKILNEGKTFVDCGTDATKIQIDGAIEINDFYTDGDNGELELVSAIRNGGSFVKIVTALNPDVANRHSFNCDIVITNATRVEENEERGLPEKVKINGVIFDFRNAMIPVEFAISGDEEGMNYFENLEASTSNPTFTNVTGLINNVTTVIKKESQGAFGGAKVDEVRRTFKEWSVNWAASAPYDFGDEEVLTIDDLKKAKQDRETKLAAEKARYEEYKASRNSGNAATATKPAASTVPKGSFTDF